VFTALQKLCSYVTHTFHLYRVKVWCRFCFMRINILYVLLFLCLREPKQLTHPDSSILLLVVFLCHSIMTKKGVTSFAADS
jgi:hypothetical protein